MPEQIKILLLEDDAADADLLKRRLQTEGIHCDLVWTRNRGQFEAALESGGLALIISDYTLPGFDGVSALELSREKAPLCPFIFVSGTLGEDVAVECLTRGATDYVLKDRLGRLGNAVRRALREADERYEKIKLEAQFLRAQRMETIGALAGGIAHDLNNALTPILMGLDLLRGQSTPADRETLVKMMQASAQRGADMVRQILSFARGVSAKTSALDPSLLLMEIERLVKESFPPSITVRSKAIGPLHPVEGNATQLHQVLLNLCVNARDAMPHGGLLQLEAASVSEASAPPGWQSVLRPGPHVVLTVSDTGYGIPPDLLSHLFEPFFTSKPEGTGTGLGLSTVKRIVRDHGGFVQVNSRPGLGTTFKVYLPVAASARLEPSGADGMELPAGHGELILVVDDELGILEMLRETLQGFGYRVLTAKHGGEALRLFQQGHGEIAAVLSDMVMPVMDGPTTIRSLRQVDPNVKVIGMSGQGFDTLQAELNALGLEHFLKKPFPLEKLLGALRQVLAQP